MVGDSTILEDLTLKKKSNLGVLTHCANSRAYYTFAKIRINLVNSKELPSSLLSNLNLNKNLHYYILYLYLENISVTQFSTQANSFPS